MSTLTIRRISHCGALVEFDGHAILIDPWFANRGWYRHGEPVGLAVEQLPPLAAIAVSQKDLTHNDLMALRGYPDKAVPVLLPTGAGRRARRAGFTHLAEMAPWEALTLGAVRVTAAPTRHFDGTPALTFVVQAGGWTVFHAGGTLPTPALDPLPQRFPHVDVALLPISGMRLLHRQVIMDPEQAARLCALIQPTIGVPMNLDSGGAAWLDGWLLRMMGTPQQFAEAVARIAPATTVRVLAPGEPLRLDAPGQHPHPRSLTPPAIHGGSHAPASS
jgi:L-ascorbate metabolism protein UlaG (beta-lactamase superfamily)